MRALKGARILINQRRSTIECQVRNLSETGAKLTLASTISVPDRFEIKLDRENDIRNCQVMWRTLTELGVRILERD